MNKTLFKSILIPFILILGSKNLSAQLSYKLFAESGYSFDLFQNDFRGFALHVSQGVQISDSGLFLGIGTGIDIHDDKNPTFSRDNSFSSIPFYLDLRFSLMDDVFGQTYGGLYYILNLGYTFPNLLSQDVVPNNNFLPGYYGLTGLGYTRVIGSKDIALNVNVGYRYEAIREEINGQPAPFNISSLVVRIGALYKPSK